MKKSVSISIVTATKNCVSTLSDCLDSVAQQSYVDVEHVIVDGMSTDGTVDLILRHADQISTFRSECDQGIYDALNKGIHLSTGDVIGFLHSDDLFATQDSLSKIASAFEDPSVCCVYSGLEYVKRSDTSKAVRYWKSSRFNKRDLVWGWMPAHPTLYVRRDWYSRIGGFDIKYQISADYLSVLQMFLHPEFNAVYIPEILVRMRLGGASNRSLHAILCKSREDWDALRRTGFGLLGAARAILFKNLRKVSQFRPRSL